MNTDHTRRDFLLASSATVLGASAAIGANMSARETDSMSVSAKLDPPASPVCISSGNGLRAVKRARERILAGDDTVLAVVNGVGIVEADPNDMSVGYGGLPNEDGVVQLDSSVMHGPTHKAGAVGAIEDIMHPAQVALKVLQSTDHVMIVGRGAYEFARAHGFKKTDMLTDRARAAWLRWKQTQSPSDDWLDPDQMDWSPDGTQVGSSVNPDEPVPFTYGTIHCAAVNTKGEVSACTTTSGLSYKIPGRVGDSPIVGAGMYVDNDIGAAGATGRGEAVIQSCGAFAVTEAMARGMEPTQACLHVLKRIAYNSSKQKRLVRPDGRPNFGVTMYALRKDGVFGSAGMYSGASFTVADAQGVRSVKCAALFG